MGANEFTYKAKGADAKSAFDAARDQAAWEHGHGGYTGTIAEKDSFVMIRPPNGVTAKEFARLIASMSIGDVDEAAAAAWERVADKWGPAGCIDLGNGEYLFFGMASS